MGSVHIPMVCFVGRCTTPRDDAERLYFHGNPLGTFIVVCQGHRGLFPDWKAVAAPTSLVQALKWRPDGGAA